MAFFTDDRTESTTQSHTVLIGGRDRYLSGWRCNDGRASYAYWACRPEDADAVSAWVAGRSDLTSVRRRGERFVRGLSQNSDVHVYVVADTHQSLAK
jgi:hypothetical protein